VCSDRPEPAFQRKTALLQYSVLAMQHALRISSLKLVHLRAGMLSLGSYAALSDG
jgi:hypothetical protein